MATGIAIWQTVKIFSSGSPSSVKEKKNGEAVVGRKKRFQLYTNPMCPFAQRVWIMISELEAMEMVAFTPIPLKPDLLRAKYLAQLPSWAHAVGVENAEGLQHLKDWYMAHINKAGEVPSVIDDCSSNTSTVFKESDIVAEYLYLVLHNHEREVKIELFPSSSYFPEEVVRFRFAFKTFPISAFYTCLRNQDPQKDEDLFKSLRTGLASFISHMSDDGPYYLGHRFSFADIAFAPFLVRFSELLPHYRGFDVFEPCEEYDSRRFKVWFHAVTRRPSVRRTSPQRHEILQFYEVEANDGRINENGFGGRGRS